MAYTSKRPLLQQKWLPSVRHIGAGAARWQQATVGEWASESVREYRQKACHRACVVAICFVTSLFARLIKCQRHRPHARHSWWHVSRQKRMKRKERMNGSRMLYTGCLWQSQLPVSIFYSVHAWSAVSYSSSLMKWMNYINNKVDGTVFFCFSIRFSWQSATGYRNLGKTARGIFRHPDMRFIYTGKSDYWKKCWCQ